MYSKISREKPSHQLKEKNKKAEYHSWSLSLPTTAAEKFWKKKRVIQLGSGRLEIISKYQKCIYDCTTYFQQFCTWNNVPAIEYYSWALETGVDCLVALHCCSHILKCILLPPHFPPSRICVELWRDIRKTG